MAGSILVGGKCDSLGSRLATIRNYLVPQKAALGMLGEPLDVVTQARRVQFLNGLHDAGVQRAALLREHAVVSDVPRQGVMERIGGIGTETRGIEELRGLQP